MILRTAFLSIAAATLLAGCQAGEPEAAAKPPGPLYRCIGEAAYDTSAWERIEAETMAEVRAGKCTARDRRQPIMAQVAEAPGDSVRVRSVVLDKGCSLVGEYAATVTALSGRGTPVPMWDGRDSQGRDLPSGEYFINLELTWSDGRRDTSYHRVGYINTLCAGG